MNHGKRGGDSPTAGRKAVYYDITRPDGSEVVKLSYQVDVPVGYVGFIPADSHGPALLSHVHADPEALRRGWPQILEARRRV